MDANIIIEYIENILTARSDGRLIDPTKEMNGKALIKQDDVIIDICLPTSEKHDIFVCTKNNIVIDLEPWHLNFLHANDLKKILKYIKMKERMSRTIESRRYVDEL